jgi:hypothetical protein
MSERVTGPAFYFPSIEKKYGKPVSFWLGLIESSELTKHKELVDWLKADYGIGHGHATALVGYALAQRAAGEGPHPALGSHGGEDRKPNPFLSGKIGGHRLVYLRLLS